MHIQAPSAWSGKLPGARRVFITCWSLEDSSLPPTCSRCRPTYSRNQTSSLPSDLFMPSITPPSLRREPGRQRIDAQLGGRMLANSPAPTVTQKAIHALRWLLLEPKLGRAPEDPAENSGSSQLENLLLGDVVGVAGKHLAAPSKTMVAGEVSKLRRATICCGGGGRKRSTSAKGSRVMAMGRINAVHIQHPILGRFRLSVVVRAGRAGTIRQRIYGEGGHGSSRTFGAVHSKSGRSGSLNAESRDGRGGKFPEPVLHGPVEGLVRGNNVSTTLARKQSKRQEPTNCSLIL